MSMGPTFVVLEERCALLPNIEFPHIIRNCSSVFRSVCRWVKTVGIYLKGGETKTGIGENGSTLLPCNKDQGSVLSS